MKRKILLSAFLVCTLSVSARALGTISSDTLSLNPKFGITPGFGGGKPHNPAPARPFVEEGKTWRVAWVAFVAPERTQYTDYRMQGDSVIGGVVWKRIVRLPDGQPVRLVREETSRIYAYSEEEGGSKLLADFGLEMGGTATLWVRGEDGAEHEQEATVAERGVVTDDCGHGFLIIRLLTAADDRYGTDPDGGTVTVSWIAGVGNPYDLFLNDVAITSSSHYYWVCECRVGDELVYQRIPTELGEFYLPLVSGIQTQIATGNSCPAALHDLQGRRLSSAPHRGIYLQGGRKMMAK
ncbi:MAG: hypothetical protein IJ722_03470 [Alloprevotella sp.]|nr:hypothetical protein [Alloprevotella sp.]